MTGTILIRPSAAATVGIVHVDDHGHATIAIPFVCMPLALAETALEQALALVRAARAARAAEPKAASPAAHVG